MRLPVVRPSIWLWHSSETKKLLLTAWVLTISTSERHKNTVAKYFHLLGIIKNKAIWPKRGRSRPFEQRQWSTASHKLPAWHLEMVSGNERSLSSQEIPREETEPQLYSILHIKKYGQRRLIRKNPWRKPSHIQVLKWMFSPYVVTMETGTSWHFALLFDYWSQGEDFGLDIFYENSHLQNC